VAAPGEHVRAEGYSCLAGCLLVGPPSRQSTDDESDRYRAGDGEHQSRVRTRPNHTSGRLCGLRLGAAVRRREHLLGTGGRLAVPISDPDAALADPTFVALNWLAVALKASLGLVALAAVQPRARLIPRRLLLFATFGLGIGMALYGTLGLLLDALRLLSVLTVPQSAWTALRWHIFVWDPWWIVGGALFLVTARLARRREHGV
jgi:hypothetical protein